MILKNSLHSLTNKLPYVRGLQQQNKILSREKMNFDKNCCHPPGHYYSTIISVENIKKREFEIWNPENIDGIAGIELHAESQIELVQALNKYYDEMPFTKEKQGKLRYYFENNWYHYSDAILLYSIIRHFKPKKLIEIGSGFSSALMLDTNDLFFNNQIEFTFIEPNPERLFSIIKETDKKSATIIEHDAQLIPITHFEALSAGDILFIDSSHVVKTASDVNYILFEILPRLKKGVLIHFHDIFYPFEYPKDWVFEGWNWNEDYFLKAFLMYNEAFEIKLFSDYLHKHHKDVFSKMPLCYNKRISGCLWLEKKGH